MISYLAYTNLYGSVFWVLYKLFLHKTNNFLWCRMYLCFAILLTVVLPLLSFEPIFIESSNTPTTLSIVHLPEFLLKQNAQLLHQKETQNWLFVLYCVVAIVLLSRLAFRYIFMVSFLRKQTIINKGNYKIAINTKYGPGSFFNTIILPKETTDEAILKHEIAHIRFFHFYDKAAVQIILCVFPFTLPFYFIQKELEMVHEYEADTAACTNTLSYSTLMLNQHFESESFAQMHHFFHHPLKNRIMMLENSKKTNITRRVALLVSLLACSTVIVILQSCKTKEVAIAENNSQKTELQIVESDAEFVGGMDSLYAYLGNNIKYPKGDTNQGAVKVRFVITKTGTIVDATIVQGHIKSIDSTAIAVVENMPKWIPAKDKSGKPMNTYFVLPINFQLGE